MSSSSNNNKKGSNQPDNKNKSNDSNYLNFSDHLGEIKVIEQEDQNLLDDDIDNPKPQNRQDRPNISILSNSAFNNHKINQKNTAVSNEQPFQTNFTKQNHQFFSQPSYSYQYSGPQSRNNFNFQKNYEPMTNSRVLNLIDYKIQKKQPIKNSRLSTFDQQLQDLLDTDDLKSYNGPNQKKNLAIHKDQKSKKIISRLSQQFTTCPANMEQNMKSKRKARQTFSTFADFKKDEEKADQIINLQISVQNQPEKMEIQTPNIQIKNTHISINSPQKKQKGDNLAQKKPAEMRLSEARRNRQRVSMGMESLLSLMKSMDQDQKFHKKQSKGIPVVKPNSRVTVDWSSLASFIQSKDQENEKASVQLENPISLSLSNQVVDQKEQKQKESTFDKKIISQKVIERSQLINPKLQAKGGVILQEQKQDDLSPCKQQLNREPFSPDDVRCKSALRKSKNKSILVSAIRNLVSSPQPDYSRELFNKLYCNLAEKVILKRQKISELKQKKTQITKAINQLLSQFTTTAEKLAEWKKQEHDIRAEIYASRQKVSKTQLEKNSLLIEEFQLKLGIELHRLQKYNKADTQSTMKDGFFADFTYNDMMFRIKRNFKTGQSYVKIYRRVVRRKAKKDFEFNFEERTQLITAFINKKLKSCRSFTSFVVHLIRYLKEFLKYQLTIGRFYCTTEMSELQLTEKKNEIQFQIAVAKTYNFLFSVDLMELTSNGGIKITSLNQKKDIEISPGLLIYQQDANKLGNCIIYMEKYAGQLLNKEIENSLKIKENNL